MFNGRTADVKKEEEDAEDESGMERDGAGQDGTERDGNGDSRTCPPVDMFYSRGFLFPPTRPPRQPPFQKYTTSTARAVSAPVPRLTMYNFTVYLPCKRGNGAHSNRAGRSPLLFKLPRAHFTPDRSARFFFLRVSFFE